jgi:hypothetical protein
MKNFLLKLKTFILAAFVLVVVTASLAPMLAPAPAQAESTRFLAETATTPAKGLKGASDNMKTFSNSAGISTKEGTDLPTIIGKIIGGFLGILGSVFVILVIYAGFLWMTAGGNEEQVGKAKKMMTNAVIGLIIVMLAFAITNFITYYVAKGSGLTT